MDGVSSKKARGNASDNSVFVVPYRVILETLEIKSDAHSAEIHLNGEQFKTAIKSVLRGVKIDEVWYRQTYRDVDQAIKAGVYKSAKHHFVEDGYFEGRRPGMAIVDEDWYLSKYPDVAEGIETGEISSCQDHFENDGEQEGRLPQEY